MERNVSTIVVGTVIGTLIGSISALALPQKYRFFSFLREGSNDLFGLAKTFNETFLTKKKTETQTAPFISGALVGLALGTGSAFLFNPKTTKHLRDNFTKTYRDASEKAQDFVELVNQYSFKQPVKRKQTKRPIKAKTRNTTVKKAAVNAKRPKRSRTTHTKSISALA